MACVKLVILLLTPISILAASYDPLKIQQPSISLIAEQDGFMGLSAGAGGDVHINTGSNGSIYLDGEDLLFIIQVIESQPPIWKSHGPVSGNTPYGYLGEYHAGEHVKVTLSAVDPEGLPVTYTRVAGDFPPGISLNAGSGLVSGIIPDADAIYAFTVRATDGHGKFADSVFKMVVKGEDSCSSNPCTHEGICHDTKDDFDCDCVSPKGGKTCNLDCSSNPMGISTSLKYVKDAQMTGYKMSTSNAATQARYGGSSGWIGIDEESYLQIDFGNVSQIHKIATTYYTTYYYTNSYYLQYSLDGNTFHNFTDYTGATNRFTGSTSSSTVSHTFSQVMVARYVRMFPLQWNHSYKPSFRVEMYGCYNYKTSNP